MLYIITSAAARRRAAEDIMKLTGNGPTMCVEVKKYVKSRTQAQNRLYWMWLNILGPYMGYTKDEAHDTFRMHFLGTIKRVVETIELHELVSTTSLSTDEFTDYLNKIQRYAEQENVVLPIPDDFGVAMGHVKQKDEDVGQPA